MHLFQPQHCDQKTTTREKIVKKKKKKKNKANKQTKQMEAKQYVAK